MPTTNVKIIHSGVTHEFTFDQPKQMMTDVLIENLRLRKSFEVTGSQDMLVGAEALQNSIIVITEVEE